MVKSPLPLLFFPFLLFLIFNYSLLLLLAYPTQLKFYFNNKLPRPTPGGHFPRRPPYPPRVARLG